MARGATWHPARAALLGALASVPACSGDATSTDASARTGGDAARGGHSGSQGPPDAGPAGTGGAAGGSAGSGGATDCNANRATGIPVNAGTLSATVDADVLSGGATILWAAGANTLTLKTTDGSALVVVFPGCEPKSYSVPNPSGQPDAISITYTAAGGEPQWVCTYEDSSLGPARCNVDVTAYGDQRNAPVTGTFSGVLRPTSDAGIGTKTVSRGTFTFERP